MPALRRQQAQRSSTFHSTAGTFRLVSFRTGTTRVRTSAHVGFQRSWVQQPQSSFWQTFPHHTLGPGTQKSSHLESQQTFLISFSVIFGTHSFRTQSPPPHWSQRPSGGGGSFFFSFFPLSLPAESLLVESGGLPAGSRARPGRPAGRSNTPASGGGAWTSFVACVSAGRGVGFARGRGS